MTTEFFSNFPIIDYDGIKLRNIVLKSKMIKEILERNDLFHPLTIEDGERADTIAHDYYGNSELYWLVYMSNDIVDPYYDWPMTYQEFLAYINKKYGSIPEAMSTIIHWRNPDHDYIMSTYSKQNLPAEAIIGWNTPVYAYDHEMAINEAKREIRLIDKGLVQKVVSEIGRIYG